MLFDAFQRLAAQRAPLPTAPRDALRSTGADLPPPLRRFNSGREAGDTQGGAYRVAALRIVTPPDRAEIDIDASDGVTVKADGGVLPLTWLVDGAPVAAAANRRELELPARTHGFFKVSVIDATGKADRIAIRLK